MRRRPEPNVRRGLLRAAAVVVVLTLILLGIIALVSTLTAPAAKAPVIAPTVPSTPAAIRTSTPVTHKTATAKPAKAKATPAPTHKTKKDVAFRGGNPRTKEDASPTPGQV